MSKSKFGFGLLVGALAGHFLTTEKGRQSLTKLKGEVERFQADPAAYQEDVKAYVTGYVKDLTDLYDNRHVLAQQLEENLTQIQEEAGHSDETTAQVDDIVINYTEGE